MLLLLLPPAPWSEGFTVTPWQRNEVGKVDGCGPMPSLDDKAPCLANPPLMASQANTAPTGAFIQPHDQSTVVGGLVRFLVAGKLCKSWCRAWVNLCRWLRFLLVLVLLVRLCFPRRLEHWRRPLLLRGPSALSV